jgi:hypothetical protein
MKKISKEEAESLIVSPHGYGMPVRKAILTLKPGEYLVVERKDWTWKTQSPITYVNRMSKKIKKRKFECKQIADGSGWLVTCIS